MQTQLASMQSQLALYQCAFSTRIHNMHLQDHYINVHSQHTLCTTYELQTRLNPLDQAQDYGISGYINALQILSTTINRKNI